MDRTLKALARRLGYRLVMSLANSKYAGTAALIKYVCGARDCAGAVKGGRASSAVGSILESLRPSQTDLVPRVWSFGSSMSVAVLHSCVCFLLKRTQLTLPSYSSPHCLHHSV